MLYYSHKVEERTAAQTDNPNTVKAGDTATLPNVYRQHSLTACAEQLSGVPYILT